MLVTLVTDGGYASFEGIKGKKVIATKTDLGGYEIRIAELIRVSDSFVGCFDTNIHLYFIEGEVEEVQPTMINCSDSNVGKGWDGFYEQKSIKRSKFR